MAYEFHDTAHIEKRARERGFTVEQAMFTINEPASILKTPPRCGNHGEFTWFFFRPFESRILVTVPRQKPMAAGSLPDTGKNHKGFVIPITQPPIVEIDTEATAAYIRLRDTKVVATKLYGPEKGLVMLDFDADENVVGIEVVGQQEFSIGELIKQVPVKTSDAVLNRTRYVAADLQPA